MKCSSRGHFGCIGSSRGQRRLIRLPKTGMSEGTFSHAAAHRQIALNSFVSDNYPCFLTSLISS